MLLALRHLFLVGFDPLHGSSIVTDVTPLFSRGKDILNVPHYYRLLLISTGFYHIVPISTSFQVYFHYYSGNRADKCLDIRGYMLKLGGG